MPVAADPLAAVEHRAAVAHEDGDRDRRRHRGRQHAEQHGQQGVEHAQLDVDAPPGRLGGEAREPADEAVLEGLGHVAIVNRRRVRLRQ